MPMHGSASTILRLDVAALSPYASRGMTQSLEPINATSDLRRTVNGELVNFGDPIFHKYTSTITGKDQRPPSIDGVWPGRALSVECAAELSFVTAEGSAQRTAVGGSTRVEDTLTFYRPILAMMVISFTQVFDEYNAEWQWTLVLEEV